MDERRQLRELGWLLLSAFPVLMIGAGFWKLSFQQPDPRDTLRAILEHRGLWLWIHVWLAAGVVWAAAALAAFAQRSSAAGDRTWATAASTLFTLGVAVWLAAITARVTVTLWAAEQAEPPVWFSALQRALGVALGVHILLAHLASALLARSLLRTHLAPRWAAIAGLSIAALGSLGLLLAPGPFSAPLIALLYPFLLGIALVRVGWR